LERMMAVRTVLELLRLLFFPGLGTLLAGGGLLITLDRRAAGLLVGKGVDGGYAAFEGQGGEWVPNPQAGMALTGSLVALALAVLLLFGSRGDLLLEALLFASAEALPMAALLVGGGRKEEAFLPLAFRTALLRSLSFLSVLTAVSLRYPGGPDFSFRSFLGQHLFASLSLWEGPVRPVVAAALALASLSSAMLVLGDPGWEEGLVFPGGGGEALAVRSLRAAERGYLASVFTVLFLGYPGEGNGGLAFWLAVVSGWLILSVLLRAGFSRWGRVGKRKVQWWSAVPALLSLALMVGASLLG